MESRLVALKLLLDSLGVSDHIETIEDRKKVQKSVYLGQLFGPNLGYRFGWYVMGPYSPELANDYYELRDVLQAGDQSFEKYSFSASLVERQQSARQLLSTSDAIDETDWLELLASIHHLLVVQGLDEEQMRRRIKTQKPHLSGLIEQGLASLRGHSLIS